MCATHSVTHALIMLTIVLHAKWVFNCKEPTVFCKMLAIQFPTVEDVLLKIVNTIVSNARAVLSILGLAVWNALHGVLFAGRTKIKSGEMSVIICLNGWLTHTKKFNKIPIQMADCYNKIHWR